MYLKMFGSGMVLIWVFGGILCGAEPEIKLQEDMDGGFPSLDSMLQWAVGHSDPQKLREAAQKVQRLTPEDLEKRQAEVKDLMENLRMPSDAELMKIAIADLNNSSLPVEDHLRALHELLDLVEPIDNANDLHKFGGLDAVVEELDREEEVLRTSAAWVLGKASHNNPVVQKQILELDVLPKLMRMVKSVFAEEAVKALYAVSAVIRNNPDGQALFYLEGGADMLQVIMNNVTSDIRLRRKSVFLVADLAEQQLEAGEAVIAFQADNEYLKSVVDLTTVPDLDTQEKALMAIRSLLQVTDTNVLVLRNFCHLESALENLKLQLGVLMQDNNQGDFARDVDALRQEVESLFHRKTTERLSSS